MFFRVCYLFGFGLVLGLIDFEFDSIFDDKLVYVFAIFDKRILEDSVLLLFVLFQLNFTNAINSSH